MQVFGVGVGVGGVGLPPVPVPVGSLCLTGGNCPLVQMRVSLPRRRTKVTDHGHVAVGVFDEQCHRLALREIVERTGVVGGGAGMLGGGTRWP